MSDFSSRGLSIAVSEPLVKPDRSGLVRQLSQINTYEHEIRREGGYFSAAITLVDSEEGINDWIQSGINRHIEVYDPALDKIWEGFINQIEISFGENSYSIGPLISIANRVSVTYSGIDYASYPPTYSLKTQTAFADNSMSQDIYGIWEKIEGINGATDTEAEQLRDTIVNDPIRAFPFVDNQLSTGSSGLGVTLSCLGYWNYLKAYFYTNTATGQVNLSEKIQDVLAADVNSIFSTDYAYIATNTTQVVDATADETSPEALLKKILSLGDSSNNAYMLGCYNNRVFRYSAIPTTVEYQKRRGQDVTDQLGGRINPWNVRPGKWLFQPDMLVGRHPPITAESLGNDPRAMLIDVVKYTSPYTINLVGLRYSQLDQMLTRNGLGV